MRGATVVEGNATVAPGGTGAPTTTGGIVIGAAVASGMVEGGTVTTDNAAGRLSYGLGRTSSVT